MKTLALILALVAVAFTGCKPDGQLIQQFLDRQLPPTYRGNAHLEEKNPWIDLTVDIWGLRREGDRWVWDSLRYRRNGRASYGIVTLEPAK